MLPEHLKKDNRMPTVSEFFNLNKTQAQLDFVNVKVDGDTHLYIDPYALSRRRDRWSREAHETLTEFFQRVVDLIKTGMDSEALELLTYLQEPNETRLGESKGKPKGAGIGDGQAVALYEALKGSSAVKTGLIQSLEECELMIDGISKDKISDLTTNIIRGHLVEYTQEQCALHGIPVQSLPLPACYHRKQGEWIEGYQNVPLAGGLPLLLVPKILARHYGSCNSGKYYREYVLEFLQAQLLNANSSLVRTLKNGKRVVFKKDVEAQYPKSKQFLLTFSEEHKDVLNRYRGELKEIERRGLEATVGAEDQISLASMLIETLKAIPSGGAEATAYQNFMMGTLEFLFYPHLLYPKKEFEIHQGRKRIDIVFTNDAHEEVFNWIRDSLKVRCPYCIFECKNYTHDIANPELDQLLGRFSPSRGELGFVCCRTFDNLDLFIERCRDAYKDGRGLVIPFEDKFLLELLGYIEAGERGRINPALQARIDAICLN
jgi:hypothetical protein